MSKNRGRLFCLFAFLFAIGCTGAEPMHRQWMRENAILSITPIEQRAEVVNSFGGKQRSLSMAVIPKSVWFWESPLYKNAIGIQQTISVGVANSRYYRRRR